MFRHFFAAAALLSVAQATSLVADEKIDLSEIDAMPERSQFDEAVERLAIKEGKAANSKVMDKVASTADSAFTKAAIMQAKSGN